MIDGAIECVRRGLQAFIAIWPLFLVRLVETVMVLIVVVGGAVVALLSVGLHFELSDFGAWADNPEGLAEWVLSNVGTIAYLFVAVLILTGVALLIHSYFEAGVTSLYLNHFRSGASIAWSDAWDRFSLDAFTHAAVTRGWTVFLVYNIVWGVAGAVLLIPLGLMLVVLLVFRDAPVAIAFTCLGLVVVTILGIVVSIVASIWGQVAVTISAGDKRGAVEASGLAGDLLRARLGVTVITAIIIYAVVFGFSSVFSTFNLGLNALAEVQGAEYVAIAMQGVMFIVNSVVSTVLGLWSAAVWAAFVATASAPQFRQSPAASGGTVGSGNALVG